MDSNNNDPKNFNLFPPRLALPTKYDPSVVLNLTNINNTNGGTAAAAAVDDPLTHGVFFVGTGDIGFLERRIVPALTHLIKGLKIPVRRNEPEYDKSIDDKNKNKNKRTIPLLLLLLLLISVLPQNHHSTWPSPTQALPCWPLATFVRHRCYDPCSTSSTLSMMIPTRICLTGLTIGDKPFKTTNSKAFAVTPRPSKSTLWRVLHSILPSLWILTTFPVAPTLWNRSCGFSRVVVVVVVVVVIRTLPCRTSTRKWRMFPKHRTSIGWRNTIRPWSYWTWRQRPRGSCWGCTCKPFMPRGKDIPPMLAYLHVINRPLWSLFGRCDGCTKKDDDNKVLLLLTAPSSIKKNKVATKK
jgi:hypothetical protein